MPRIVPYLVLSLVLVVVGLLGWETISPSRPTMPIQTRPAIGGPFTLVDHTGKTVTEKDFRGRHMLIFFGYTYCPDVCPTNLETIRQAMTLLGERAKKIAPIFVSVDYDRDTPDVLKLYVDMFGGKITGLSGSEKQIADVAKAYGVYYAKVAEKNADKAAKDDMYLMNHSAITYLMGPDGGFLTHFSHGTTAQEMADKIGKVLN